jgi:hypothetical protein
MGLHSYSLNGKIKGSGILSQIGPARPRQAPPGPTRPRQAPPGPARPRQAPPGPARPRQAPPGPARPPVNGGRTLDVINFLFDVCQHFFERLFRDRANDRSDDVDVKTFHRRRRSRRVWQNKLDCFSLRVFLAKSSIYKSTQSRKKLNWTRLKLFARHKHFIHNSAAHQ